MNLSIRDLPLYFPAFVAFILAYVLQGAWFIGTLVFGFALGLWPVVFMVWYFLKVLDDQDD